MSLTPADLVTPHKLLRIVIGPTERARWAAVRAAVICTVPALFVFLGSAVDGTLFKEDGIGALEHLGLWMFVVTSPVITFLTWLLLRNTAKLIETLPGYTVDHELSDPLQQILNQNLSILQMRSRYNYMLVFFAFIGMAYTFVNMRWVMDAPHFYGELTFDSPDHVWGFIFTRLYVALILIYLYPTAIFVCMSVTVLLHQVLREMWQSGTFRIELFHPDNCGGFSEFGRVNLIMMGIYFCLLCELAALALTHRKHVEIQILPSGIMFALVITQSFVAVFYIHKCVQKKKQEALAKVSRLLDEKFGGFPSTVSRYGDLLSMRTHLLNVKTYPYARHILGFVNFLRFASPVVALLQFVVRKQGGH